VEESERKGIEMFEQKRVLNFFQNREGMKWLQVPISYGQRNSNPSILCNDYLEKSLLD
jgi:hypothetical protein